jgi:ATP-dependent Lhr-like helicase
MILRNYKGWEISVGRQQVNSQLILNAVERIDQNFPILKETYREILNDVMDLPRAQEILTKIRKKEIKVKIIKTDMPSPFSHKMVTFGHSDIIMMKSRHMYLPKLHSAVMESIKGK